jgi:hypothetical protein
MPQMPRFAALLLAVSFWPLPAAARQTPAPFSAASQRGQGLQGSQAAPVQQNPGSVQPVPDQGPNSVPLQLGDDTAVRTREQLRALLRMYPPSVADVLRLDSSLLTNPTFLATYPQLTAFLRVHPEIIHNPGYFVGQSRDEWEPGRRTGGAVNAMENMFIALIVLTGVITLLGLIGWGAKTLVDHRRWLRMSKIQTDAHTKLLDRFTANEDLLAYIQTRAGSRFLESAPFPVDNQRPLGSPIGRILFSAQAGTVAMFAGIGLQYASQRVSSSPDLSDVGPFLFTVAVVVTAIGLGFLVSSGVAYVMSRHLGLLETKAPTNA